MRIAIDTQTILGQKSGFGFYIFTQVKIPRNPNRQGER
ncbi:MAG: hypothetical protein UT28_C0001G0375 [Berkelbacteria bacterium GW2011_GWE1_39_12]|uniref:Uncharacterized protein n=1 Tax=Berkelbacteria bacterium GW2011_GWE1_39_12 TaxID=1618337 RepID=A0A0G4B2Q8_9BACT|nr:MAG: hypothetical protein UT28_C0001G0375 [Berkelbacteria bacterium GW2011_GWE1_39_12]